ncbi:hypothetical protein EV1_034558 [Malus domestica]
MGVNLPNVGGDGQKQHWQNSSEKGHCHSSSSLFQAQDLDSRIPGFRFQLGDDNDSSGSLGAMVDELQRLRVKEL